MSYLSALHGIKGGKAQSNFENNEIVLNLEYIVGLNLSKMGTMLTASNTVFFLVDDPKKELVEEIAEVCIKTKINQFHWFYPFEIHCCHSGTFTN